MLVAITLVNFLYLLMQIVMAAENCGVLEAVPHVARLLRRRWKELGQVLAAILALMLMATGASILATTQLGLIGFVPFVGLAALAAAGLRVAGARRRLPIRRPDRCRDLPAHALRAAVRAG